MERNPRVIDLFSGAGGLSLGFRRAGFDIVLANEIDSAIAGSYSRNHPGTLMLNTDIRYLVDNFDKVLADGAGARLPEIRERLKEVDVIIGGPPCQGFSMAGGRIRRAKEFCDDERNYLFRYYFEMIRRFEPAYFVFENVTGILSSHNGDIIRQIEAIFSDAANFTRGAYSLSINTLNAADFGVPQNRRRVLIIGSRKPFDFDEVRRQVLAALPDDRRCVFTTPRTVRDAIADLQEISPYEPNAVPNHVATRHSAKALERMARVRPNENWTALDEEIKSVHSGAYGRLDWHRPATTITTRFDTPSAGRYIHPVLDRTLTPREAARIQSFPDDYVFHGSKSSVCTQIGNAVPPRLAEFLALMIKYLMKNEKSK